MRYLLVLALLVSGLALVLGPDTSIARKHHSGHMLSAGELKGFQGPVVPVLDRLNSPPASRALAPLIDELNAAMPAGSGVTFVYQDDHGSSCDLSGYGVNDTPPGTITVCDGKGLLDGAYGRGATEVDGSYVLRGRVTITSRGNGRGVLCHELMHVVAHAAHEDADRSLGGCLANTTDTFGPDDIRLLALAYP